MTDISRAGFLKKMGVYTAGLATSSMLPYSKNVCAAPESEQRQNFIFIFCDDLGWADLPCHGHKSVTAHGGWIVRDELKMPNVDRMASEGTIFTQFYVASAVCSPSRTGIMTGLFPSRLGIHDYLATQELNKERGMPDFVDPKIPTVTSILKQSGYATAHFGKWHLGSGSEAPQPEQYGIDRYKNCLDGPGKRPGSTEMIADRTISFIDSHRYTPFYINVWLYDPHSPLHPTDEQLEPYAYLSPKYGDQKGALQIWYSVLTNIDRHVGRILDKLDDLGLSENTYVIFSSDNGPESGLMSFTSHYGGASSTNTGPFRGIKRSLYEGGIREPFIVRCPGNTPAGHVDSKTVIGGVDYLPTICSLAGAELPSDLHPDGENMATALAGNQRNKTKPLMWENRFPVYGHVIHKSPMLAIRDGDWKLLMNPDNTRIELYDIPNDPTELSNVAEKYPELVLRLSHTLLEWQKTLPEGPLHKDAGSNYYPWPGENN
ncbi:MAG: sulfatase-like hydrolase/transferase [Candidatus Latescibacteria bacterium]|nr:sulfatase-like hydrolase/transferase [Candidatus Latescibacterota bacterium]